MRTSLTTGLVMQTKKKTKESLQKMKLKMKMKTLKKTQYSARSMREYNMKILKFQNWKNQSRSLLLRPIDKAKRSSKPIERLLRS